MWTMKLQGDCFSKVSDKFSQQALKALKHTKALHKSGCCSLVIRALDFYLLGTSISLSLSLSSAIRCHYRRGTSPNRGMKHTQPELSIWRLQFQSYHDCLSHSMSSMIRKPGKVTLPTAHYSHQKTSPKKSNRKYAKRPTEISLTTWAEMISGQARESWKPSIVMVFAGFISASSIIIVWWYPFNLNWQLTSTQQSPIILWITKH